MQIHLIFNRQNRTQEHLQGAAAALVAKGAGAPGIEGLSLGAKRIEEVETNTMGGSPRAEDDGSGRYSEVNGGRFVS
jgi:hypothetical protein